MNCTVCGKPHTKEHPLTIAQNDEWLCPGCLKELDKPTGEAGRVVFEDDALDALRFMGSLYGRSPISCYSGTFRIGDVELPIESFEMR